MYSYYNYKIGESNLSGSVLLVICATPLCRIPGQLHPWFLVLPWYTDPKLYGNHACERSETPKSIFTFIFVLLVL